MKLNIKVAHEGWSHAAFSLVLEPEFWEGLRGEKLAGPHWRYNPFTEHTHTHTSLIPHRQTPHSGAAEWNKKPLLSGFCADSFPWICCLSPLLRPRSDHRLTQFQSKTLGFVKRNLRATPAAAVPYCRHNMLCFITVWFVLFPASASRLAPASPSSYSCALLPACVNISALQRSISVHDEKKNNNTWSRRLPVYCQRVCVGVCR